MRRRHFLTQLFSLSAAAAAWQLPGCAQSATLSVGIHPWIGYETLYLAQEFNWLPSETRFLPGKVASDSLVALTAGRVDCACLTLDEVLRGRAAGLPLSIALVFNVSAGADVVLARSAIRQPSDLAGKRIGYEKNALGALVLHGLLSAAGLPPSAVRLVDLPPDRQFSAWQQGEVDALITYEPTATRLRRVGARQVFDSRMMPNTIFDVLAVRRDLARAQRAVFKAVIASHFRALEHLRINHQDAIYRIATRQELAPEEVERAIGGVVLPSLAANRSYLKDAGGTLAAAAGRLSGLMKAQGLLLRDDALEHLLDASWLPLEEA